MKKLFLSCVCLLFLLPYINDISALEMDTVGSDEVTVRFEKPLMKVALEVLNLFPSVRQEIEDKFRSELGVVPTVMLIKDRDTFREIAGNSPVVAVALSKENLIIIDNSRMKSYPFTLRVTLKHELCHLFLHHYLGEGNLPRWLNEGISQWVSDGIAELAVGENKSLLKQATLSGNLIPLGDITEKFPGDERSLLLAYEESKGVVEYIAAEFGSDGILRVLRLLRDGFDVESAFMSGTGSSLSDLEKSWREHMIKQITWFTYISDHLYQIMFVLSALLLTYAAIRVFIKKLTYKDEEE